MDDNFPLTPGTGDRLAATDVVTHSGDEADVQLVREVGVTGPEGSKTAVVIPVDPTYGKAADVTRVPSDPFGADADPADPAGSISAKLRALAQSGVNVLALPPVAVASMPAVDVASLPPVVPDPYHASLFGGWRVGHDFIAMERVHTYPGPSTAYDPDFYGIDLDVGAVGSVSHVAAESALSLALSAATVGGKARLRTHDLLRYQPGAMPVIQQTAMLSDATGWALHAIRRTSTSGSPVDTDEGTLGGVTPNVTNRYEIRFAWLGVQAVQWWVNGVLALEKVYAGTLTAPYIGNAILPLSVEVLTESGPTQRSRIGLFDDANGLFFEWRRTSGTGATSLKHICSSARIVNGGDYATRGFTFSRAVTNVAATLVPLFSMRVGATLNGIASLVQMLPRHLAFFAETAAGRLDLVLNPTLTGATWAQASPSGAVQIDSAASALSGGTSLFSVSHAQNGSQTYDLDHVFTFHGLKVRRDAFTGASNVLTIAVVREGAVSFDPRATVTWDELR